MKHEKSCGAVVFTKVNGEIKYLLVSNISGVYGFPKGHVEGDETEIQTALREVYEETHLKINLIDGFRATEERLIFQNTAKKHITYFLGSFENQQIIYQKKELSNVFLASYEQAIELFQFESLKRILTEANDFLMNQANA